MTRSSSTRSKPSVGVGLWAHAGEMNLIPGAIARIDDRIGAVTTCGKIVGISSGPTGQEVIAGSAIERIRATLAKQGIVAAEAKEGVVPARGVEHVVSTAASSDGVHVVVSTITDQSIVHCCCYRL